MTVRKVKASEVSEKVKDLCYRANIRLRPDIENEIGTLHKKAKKGSAEKRMLKVLMDNAKAARNENIPMCQDTGLACVFVEIGGEVVVVDGNIEDAINKGVEDAYKSYNFRKSVVLDPITRRQSETNTPAPVHFDMVKGKKIKITVMPKGFGSENKSAIAMLDPTASREMISEFCVEVVRKAGPDACPPYVLGIGIGGTMDLAALLSKKALLRPIDRANPKEHISRLEETIKKTANKLGIGIMGLGGKSTVMGVNIETAPTHIAGCPVAVNVCCHALRSASGVI
jgi:fumarate hydratase subunit alpha